MVVKYWQSRIRDPILRLLRQGLSPDQLALTIALGIAFGTIPALGTTTIACALAASAFRLNQAAIQGVNLVVYPLQLALLLPFLRLGSLLFGDGSFHLNLEQIIALGDSGIASAISSLGMVTIQGLAVWLLLAGPSVAIIYFTIRPILRFALQRQQST